MQSEPKAPGPKEVKPNHVLVEVSTTAGTWPSNGFEEVPEHQKVKIALKKAVDALGIQDTTEWVAIVGDREINPELSYQELSLSGEVSITYGRREGGGGRE